MRHSPGPGRRRGAAPLLSRIIVVLVVSRVPLEEIGSGKSLAAQLAEETLA
jgi:hypothetical protein